MSDNDSKLPGKNIQIILTIVFAVIALGLVMIVKPFGTVQVEGSKTAAPGAQAPGGAQPPSKPPTKP